MQSGIYKIHLPSGKHRVYCEMGINGGSYTFLPFESLASLTESDLKVLVTDRRDVLMRISQPNGAQPYTVIRQLQNTGGLSIQVNSYKEHTKPLNTHLGPYIFIGTLPASHARNEHKHGFISNGIPVTFKNCNGKDFFFAFFSNPYEKAPANGHASDLVYERRGVAVDWRGTAKRPPSGRRMPLDFFLFTEIHYGGCGCYTESQRWLNAVHPALGTAIGLR